MTTAAAIIKQLRDQRSSWCTLQPGVRVRIIRPPETELPQFYKGVELAAVQKYAVGWEGVSTALLFGEAVGSSDPLDFDLALWSEIVADRTAWLEACARHLVEVIDAHLQTMDKQLGNSEPSSTSLLA